AAARDTTKMFAGTIGCLRASDTESTDLELIFQCLLSLKVGEAAVGKQREDQLHLLYDTFFQHLLSRLLEFKGVTFKITRNEKEAFDNNRTIRAGIKRTSCISGAAGTSKMSQAGGNVRPAKQCKTTCGAITSSSFDTNVYTCDG